MLTVLPVNVVPCEDYRDPHKEFFRLFLQEATEKFVADGRLLSWPADIDRKRYFAVGVVMG